MSRSQEARRAASSRTDTYDKVRLGPRTTIEIPRATSYYPTTSATRQSSSPQDTYHYSTESATRQPPMYQGYTEYPVYTSDLSSRPIPATESRQPKRSEDTARASSRSGSGKSKSKSSRSSRSDDRSSSRYSKKTKGPEIWYDPKISLSQERSEEARSYEKLSKSSRSSASKSASSSASQRREYSEQASNRSSRAAEEPMVHEPELNRDIPDSYDFKCCKCRLPGQKYRDLEWQRAEKRWDNPKISDIACKNCGHVGMNDCDCIIRYYKAGSFLTRIEGHSREIPETWRVARPA